MPWSRTSRQSWGQKKFPRKPNFSSWDRNAKADQAKVPNIGRELSTTSKQLLSDETKLQADYDELATPSLKQLVSKRS
jgi:hypothetical protein